jgi:uncharacterized protein (DUF1697 family)
MPRHIALLRAINVGGRTVKMDHLRTLFGELGFKNVVTLIASGNVTFDASTADAAKLELKIERHLYARLGFSTETFMRSTEELKAVLAHDAFPAAKVKDARALWIAFLKQEPSRAAINALMAARCATDDFHVRGREVYWLRRSAINTSEFKSTLDKVLGMPTTARNITTVRKLAAL